MTKINPSDVVFLPLGGMGEIGRNLYLYGYKDKWLVVDFGLSFADESVPGVEVLLPDISFIQDNINKIAGIVITHAHEDHIGALPYIWHETSVPIYATPFTAFVIREKYKNEKAKCPPITVVDPGNRVMIGPFDVELVGLTHSTPESCALAIRTDKGIVVHSGDWKFDDTPVVGDATDYATLKKLGQEGVLAYIGDSTNILEEFPSQSEASLFEGMKKVMLESEGSRVVVTCFSSNIARLETIAKAAEAADRDVAILGRSVGLMEKAARATGYLQDVAPFLDAHEAGFIPRERIVLISTGCQGEPQAALTRLAYNNHPELRLSVGDVVVYSSSQIPGNEKAIIRVQNQLITNGIHVVTEGEAHVHVTGHPGKPEVKKMYEMLKPKLAIPMHGEPIHLAAHQRLAHEMGVKHTRIVECGQIVVLSEEGIELKDMVQTGSLALDGNNVIPQNSFIIKQRHKIIWNGAAVISIVLGAGNKKPSVKATLLGLVDPEKSQELIQTLEHEIKERVMSMPDKDLKSREKVAEVAKSVLRGFTSQELGKKPLVEVHVHY